MGNYGRKAESRVPRISREMTSRWIVSVLVVVSAHVGLVDASSSGLTGVWQHVGKNGQTTLRVLDTDSDIHVVVEGLNFLTFDEYRFVPDGADRKAGKRLVTCTRDGDSLVTEFRRMGTNETEDGATEVVRSSDKIVWHRADDSTLKLSVSGSRGFAAKLARDFIFSRKDTNNKPGYNHSEEEEEQ